MKWERPRLRGPSSPRLHFFDKRNSTPSFSGGALRPCIRGFESRAPAQSSFALSALNYCFRCRWLSFFSIFFLMPLQCHSLRQRGAGSPKKDISSRPMTGRQQDVPSSYGILPPRRTLLTFGGPMLPQVWGPKLIPAVKNHPPSLLPTLFHRIPPKRSHYRSKAPVTRERNYRKVPRCRPASCHLFLERSVFLRCLSCPLYRGPPECLFLSPPIGYGRGSSW